MERLFVRGLDGFGSGFDVFALGAGEGGDTWGVGGAADLGCDGVDAGEVAMRGDGEAGFDDVDAEGCELVGHAQLFVVVHGAARRLFAVAEGGVEEDYVVAGCHVSAPFFMDRIITRSYAQCCMYCEF